MPLGFWSEKKSSNVHSKNLGIFEAASRYNCFLLLPVGSRPHAHSSEEVDKLHLDLVFLLLNS